MERTYLCIDLKSFYASVECVERGLDPLTTDLVVADPTRTEKTICLAVSPSLKAKGVKNRCRVFEIPKNMDYIMAPPRMQLYIDYAANIYGVYLKYISKDDIHVYSIDEAFLDVTNYLNLYRMTARELAITIMQDILDTTGVTATCGIGTNLYLTKVALDITAKHVNPEPGGARIGILTEETYRATLWDHLPLTDFWRIGARTAARLDHYGLHTMRQIAKAPEELLYKVFGIDAELLIDHAWGRESTTMADIKAYKPSSNSLSSGQVLPCDYPWDQGRLVTREMTDNLVLDLADKRLVTDSVSLMLGYSKSFGGQSVHAGIRLEEPTCSTRKIMAAVDALYCRIALPEAPLRRINVVFGNIVDEAYQQYSLFSDPAESRRERQRQDALLSIKKRYGKNAILKAMDLMEGATAAERNNQIGGHRA